MALKKTQKADRVKKLLNGLRDPRVFEALSVVGYTDRDEQEGLDLLHAFMHARSGRREPDPDVIANLEEFARDWFGVAKHSLQRHHPRLAELVFADLVQGRGEDVVITVPMFLDRLRAMEAGTYGADGPEAMALLARRGLTAEVIAAADAEVARLAALQLPANPSNGAELAEQAMWAWYLEWSGIARTRIRNKQLLRELGFGRAQRDAEDEEVVTGDAGTTTAPAATQPVQLPVAPTAPSPLNGTATSHGTTA